MFVWLAYLGLSPRSIQFINSNTCCKKCVSFYVSSIGHLVPLILFLYCFLLFLKLLLFCFYSDMIPLTQSFVPASDSWPALCLPDIIYAITATYHAHTSLYALPTTINANRSTSPIWSGQNRSIQRYSAWKRMDFRSESHRLISTLLNPFSVPVCNLTPNNLRHTAYFLLFPFKVIRQIPRGLHMDSLKYIASCPFYFRVRWICSGDLLLFIAVDDIKLREQTWTTL